MTPSRTVHSINERMEASDLMTQTRGSCGQMVGNGTPFEGHGGNNASERLEAQFPLRLHGTSDLVRLQATGRA